MIAQELEVSLHMAFMEARQKRHEFITVEHLLLALLDNPSASEVLRACAADIDDLRKLLSDFVTEHTPILAGDDVDTQPTLGFQRVIQRAILHVQSSGKKEVTGANVLVAIFGEKDSHAVYFLHQKGVTRLDVVNYISHGISKVPQAQQAKTESDSETEHEAQPGGALENYTLNLNALALSGKIDPLIGREKELERVVQTLCRRRKNNPLLVGEAGVGKTAIAEGLARRIVEGSVPDILKKSNVYALDMGALLAGTKYRGDFEQRLKSVLKQLVDNPHAILFIDEIHTLIGAGAASGGTLDASNLLKPALSTGQLKCIGATTYNEYRGVFEKDHALSRRFQKIDVIEPTVAETVLILKGLKSRFEAHHGVKYQPSALTRGGRAFRALHQRPAPARQGDRRDRRGRRGAEDPAEVEAEARDQQARDRRDHREDHPHPGADGLDRRPQRAEEPRPRPEGHGVRPGQGDRRARGRDQDGPQRPRQPAEADRLLPVQRPDRRRQDRSRAPARLHDGRRADPLRHVGVHGAPRGVAADRRAARIRRLRPGRAADRADHQAPVLGAAARRDRESASGHLQHPAAGDGPRHAHRQQRAQGRLPQRRDHHDDQRGRRRALEDVDGLHRDASRSGDEMGEIKRMFTPEFRNRLDAIISFQALDHEIILRVVDKFLMQLEDQLHEKKVEITFTPALKEHLAKTGFDPLMGARPMARLIQDTIRRALADELLFGRLASGGKVTVDVDESDKVQSRLRGGGARGRRLTPLSTAA